ncbi:hypothetical protein GGR60_002374 [Xanthomonas arboricola]|uniref:Uncharacterized protein n=1 Tax=Xanthomonas euroxanthea TaxID=2259622 RepID=A0AA46H9F5_9XANT|nr:hypothetical protein [Xanthomonas euroxanthea]NJC37839.1 hypothetical protein [Xanthomonas euroxanthea]SUZ26995.1 hypothetical protein CPBF424_07570 [Xanthomonas euroxanthea]
MNRSALHLMLVQEHGSADARTQGIGSTYACRPHRQSLGKELR